MRKPRPKMRNYTVRRVPDVFIDENNLEALAVFIPVNLKYYRVISAYIEAVDYYPLLSYFDVVFNLEKLQNLQSYYKSKQ